MSDELAATNRERWNALVAANVEYARPMLELTPETARSFLDPLGILGNVSGSDVLCLGSGGGQQSVAFALLGADVTVFDLSDNQLERDLQAAAHYGVKIRAVQGDMRNLGAFEEDSFDLVYHPYSINFVPKIEPVIAEVARVCRSDAHYRVEWHNPFIQLIEPEKDWTGSGYLLSHEYINGREATDLFPTWGVKDEEGGKRELDSPREFVHTLSTMINTLATNGFVILRALEYTGDGQEGEAGSWPHFVRIAAPYLTLWSRYVPTLLR